MRNTKRAAQNTQTLLYRVHAHSTEIESCRTIISGDVSDIAKGQRAAEDGSEPLGMRGECLAVMYFGSS